MPSEQAKELMLYNQNELLRMIAMKSEQEAIELELENKGIKFMLLKGSVIRNYYPQQKMRQMSDVDILYDGSKKEQLFDIMLSHGYSVMSCSENSDDFTKKPFYTFEFHRELFFSEHDFYFDFSYVWKNASQSKENTCKYEMSVDDLYLHSVAHMYKHYVLGGFGVRFLSDTYLTLTKNEGSMNFEYIASKLKEMNLTGFEEFVRKLSYELFGEGNFTSEQIEFLNSSFKFGIYGDTTQGVKLYYDEYLSRKGGKGTVLGYYASKIFPSARFMKRTYPKLNKCPYLLPLYYIYRLFDKLLFKSKATRENYKLLKQYNKEK
jgi:predicted nucleotidyltransferase